MRIPRERIEPGEWETDKNGRRFRSIGKGCIEYEPLIKIDGVEIPQSELAEYHQRRREAEKARGAAEKVRPEPPAAKDCPFKDGLHTTCNREKCALYWNGCTIPQLINAPARKDTRGLQCPINKRNQSCREYCAFYSNGCVLTAVRNSFKESEV